MVIGGLSVLYAIGSLVTLYAIRRESIVGNEHRPWGKSILQALVWPWVWWTISKA